MIFVDTGAWFARYVTDDTDHNAAAAWFAKVPDRLITTDYVIDELLTLLKVRGYPEIAYSVGAPLISGQACVLEYVKPTDIQRAWIEFSTYRDKDWSFTDCPSRVVMQRLNIRTACAFDDHFRQFGNVTVLPQ
jgi:predicted nucleic acid-binding protein